MSSESSSSGHTPLDNPLAEAGLTGRHLQNVFRIAVHGKTHEHVFHARRAHRKSRAGCLTCKKRRIKCDEQKPHCQRCQKKGIQCDYSTESNSSLDGNAKKSVEIISTPSDPSTICFSFSLDNVMENVEGTLSLDPKCIKFLTISMQTPYLMYTILGVAMLHMNRVSPNKERSIAESFFWQRAIELYQAELSSKIHQANVDAILSSCMLMGAMTICPEHFDPTESWVLTNRPEAMNWLALQSGIQCILNLAGPFIPGSIWANAFAYLNKEERQIFEGIEQGREGLDSDLADLCGIDEFTTDKTNIYYSPLRILTPLFELEKTVPNAGHCASFMGRLDCDFLSLLRQRDSPALVILAQWMGLMCSLAELQPWIEGRIRGECIAICMFLEHSPDPRILQLLKFPAKECGYQLKTENYLVF
ncbi:C6 transcription factor [Penicillium atrosanguineum]|uniref:C6 transcription factor n=1 Tax=Penicillium atrosanguineum TaxID=1132637 RepID=A0A9W9HF92_9EURO|nr:C6 transcription factor [Penicillium atrosanguineum]KAJ5144632.1 C6 transcription factor [Penicillium atrosanguineum]KAJ5311066.1 C6 transcription factor [Penicillium atrosanguineum]